MGHELDLMHQAINPVLLGTKGPFQTSGIPS